MQNGIDSLKIVHPYYNYFIIIRGTLNEIFIELSIEIFIEIFIEISVYNFMHAFILRL